MTLIFVLWLVTSNYAQQIAAYPNPMTCAAVAAAATTLIDRKPRPMIGRLICIPTPVAGPPPVADGPKFGM